MILPRGIALWFLLMATAVMGGCASGAGEAGSAAQAKDASGAAVGAAPATPQQVFNSGETTQTVPPSQMRMLGPVAGGAAAHSLVPGY